MKHIIEKHLTENAKKYIFFIGILILGVIIGVLTVNNTKNEAKEEINVMIAEFITNIKENTSIDYISILKKSIEKNIKLIVFIIAISFSIWGEAGNIVLVGYKGFSLGYSLASVFYILGIGKGLLFSLSLLFISQIFLIPTILYIIVSCMNTYKKILLNEYDDIKYLIIKNILCLSVAIVISIFSSFVHTFLCSNLFLLFTKFF